MCCLIVWVMHSMATFVLPAPKVGGNQFNFKACFRNIYFYWKFTCGRAHEQVLVGPVGGVEDDALDAVEVLDALEGEPAHLVQAVDGHQIAADFHRRRRGRGDGHLLVALRVLALEARREGQAVALEERWERARNGKDVRKLACVVKKCALLSPTCRRLRAALRIEDVRVLLHCCCGSRRPVPALLEHRRGHGVGQGRLALRPQVDGVEVELLVGVVARLRHLQDLGQLLLLLADLLPQLLLVLRLDQHLAAVGGAAGVQHGLGSLGGWGNEKERENAVVRTSQKPRKPGCSRFDWITRKSARH